MGMVYGKAAFNAFLEILPIGILLSSKEKGSSSERSFPQNILFCTIAFAETKSPTASREQKLSLAELRCTTSSFEAVLNRINSRNPGNYRVFRHKRAIFPLELSHPKGWIYPMLTVCSKAAVTTVASSHGLLYLAFA